MEKELLRKKFSVGLTLLMSDKEYKKIINKYKDYINDIYFSPPFGSCYHSRNHIMKILKPCPETFRKFYSILNYAKSKGILLNLALNTYTLKKSDIEFALKTLKGKVEVDSISTLNEYAPLIRKLSPDTRLVYSYNNGTRSLEDLDSINKGFKMVVLGNSCLRNFSLFKKIKEKGFEIKLLLNNGCSFNCGFCRKAWLCKPIFEKNLEWLRGDINFLYALQSVFPWEFKKYYIRSPFIDTFKISNRSCNFRWLDNCLSSYITNQESKYMTESKKGFHLWARLGVFSDKYPELDYDKICEYKKEIWDNLATKSQIDTFEMFAEKHLEDKKDIQAKQ